MVDVDSELRVARTVHDALLERDARDIGLFRRRNESPPGMRVDFTFDEPVDPPAVALEVTRLYEQRLRQGQAALRPTGEALEDAAESEGLGGWLIAVDAYATMKKLRPHILEIMRRGHDVRVNDYSLNGTDAPGDALAVIRQHRRWASVGLISAERSDLPGVRVAGLSGGRGIDGFRDLLDVEIKANADKLMEARDRETHLAVEVHRFDCSTLVERTDEPDLPGSIDFLWVIFRWAHGLDRPPLWRLRRGGTWEVIDAPLEME